MIAAGYPDRVPHTEVIARFGSLVTGQVSVKVRVRVRVTVRVRVRVRVS